MLQEIGRIITAIAALLVAMAGRVWRGMQWLVRHALAARVVTANGVPRLGRLLDLAALSVAADLLFLAELWRRGSPVGSGWASLFGALAAVAICGALYFTQRSLIRLTWAALTILRVIALAVLALAPPVFLVGGGSGSSKFFGALAVAVLVAMLLVDRFSWVLTMRSLLAPTTRGRFVAGTLSYVAYTMPWAIGLALIALMIGGLWPLTIAEVLLVAVAIIVLTLPGPTVDDEPRPPVVKQPTRKSLPTQPVAPQQPIAPTEILPPVGAHPGDAEAEGYSVYRPSTLDD
ncbi:hypothetical protein F4553_004715 [Allocatelliglobosispora scoriae]|uniref:Uncharacterized protein n=1 Tax=Allocatelliglobosispora scoriae TaxID=643052 RepID=A0A841BV47_9ACTN|nr:hypothetical protein [Allocatelliglobosispora scoriae]MBB5871336.1 hypothetical protein [Allocatelliglobosispora scoriae]